MNILLAKQDLLTFSDGDLQTLKNHYLSGIGEISRNDLVWALAITIHSKVKRGYMTSYNVLDTEVKERIGRYLPQEDFLLHKAQAEDRSFL